MLSRIRVFPHLFGAAFVAAVLAFAVALLLGGGEPGGPAQAGAHAGGGAPSPSGGVRVQGDGDPGPPQRTTGDDHCPPRVPKPPVPKRPDPKDREPENVHATKFDGPAPKIRWQDAPDGKVCVTWSLPKETGGRVPGFVEVAIHAIYGLYPANVGKFAPVRRARRPARCSSCRRSTGPTRSSPGRSG